MLISDSDQSDNRYRTIAIDTTGVRRTYSLYKAVIIWSFMSHLLVNMNFDDCVNKIQNH